MPSEREYSKAYEKPPEQSFLGNVASEIWDHITGADQNQRLSQDASAKKFLTNMSIGDDNVVQKKTDAEVGQIILQKKLDYED
jgi:hypothetical protein